MGALASKDDACVEVSEAAGLDRVVGRLHHDHELGLVELGQ